MRLSLFAGRNSTLILVSGLTKRLQGVTTAIEGAAVTIALTKAGEAVTATVTLASIGGGDYEAQLPTAETMGLAPHDEVDALVRVEHEGLHLERRGSVKVRKP